MQIAHAQDIHRELFGSWPTGHQDVQDHPGVDLQGGQDLPHVKRPPEVAEAEGIRPLRQALLLQVKFCLFLSQISSIKVSVYKYK